MNPDDLELVREAAMPAAGALGGIEHFEVQEERRVSRGGAVVRSAAGEVDAHDRDQARARPRGAARRSWRR